LEGGEALSPKSRKALPKHLMGLIRDKTMVQGTVGRVKGVASEENVYIVAEEGQQGIIAEQPRAHSEVEYPHRAGRKR